jgi:hypothetical protein
MGKFTMTEKELKQLNNAYSKLFNNLYKEFFVDRSTGLLLFVEYLKYIRDISILTEKDSEHTIKTAAITATIAEFDAYRQTVEQRQKAFHWNNFCELLKYNMEDWLKIDDSV